ncbi:MAG: DNRLRE domain-containing protein, partial [Calditrichales bacterium]
MNNRALILLFVLPLIFSWHIFAQTSSLVYPGEDGTLLYIPYANQGQNNAVNKIPDFSYAGYMGGGVSLPDVPVVETLYPEPGDARSRIQAAIDRVSALTPDASGFRGAVLLTSGLYEINGSLDINQSGIVLRGAGQNTAENGGTELIATAQTQHSFIRLQGNEIAVSPVSELTLDTQQYPGIGNWITFNVTNGIVDELESDKVISFHIFTDINQFTSYASREDALQNPPTLTLTLNLNGTGSDSLITLYPIADTYVRGGDDAENNFGSEASLAIKNGGTTVRVTREVYLKFDLSSVTEEISHADLKLYGKKDLTGEPIQTVFHTIAYMKDDSWEEMEINFNNRPMDGAGSAFMRITTPYVASGAFTFDVDSASNFNVGDSIIVVRTPNQTWIDELEMAQYGWTADSYVIGYERIITAINGNTISINIPLVQAMEDLYGGGSIYKSSIKGRIRNCGVENMMISSIY